MGKHVIMEINGICVELRGTTPVRILSKEDYFEIKRQSTPQYKAQHSTDAELLGEYLESLIRGKTDDAMIYKKAILTRMANK